MASPPPFSATSPPSSSPLALPRQRPQLALPGQSSSRKPSVTTASAGNSAHPLRQTSFPPPDSLEAQHAAAEDAILRFSPSQASQGSLEDEFSDTEIVSAISAPNGDANGPGASRKRKRGEKKPRGRPSKAASQSQHGRQGSASVVNGERGSRGETAGAGSGAEDDDEDDDLGGTGAGATGRAPLYAGGEMTPQEALADNEAKAAFRNYMDYLITVPLTSTNPTRAGVTSKTDATERYSSFQHVKLTKADVRRLVNQTLSQSVPGNVVMVVSAYTKLFALDLITEARRVQEEWMSVESKRADGQENPTWKKLKIALDAQAHEEDEEELEAMRPASSSAAKDSTRETNGEVTKKESSATQPDTQTTSPTQNGTADSATPLIPGGAGGLQHTIEQCDRGPLLPDHLREALRRYKKQRAGGPVGFTGHSLEGREVAAPRMGGRRLFR